MNERLYVAVRSSALIVSRDKGVAHSSLCILTLCIRMKNICADEIMSTNLAQRETDVQWCNRYRTTANISKLDRKNLLLLLCSINETSLHPIWFVLLLRELSSSCYFTLSVPLTFAHDWPVVYSQQCEWSSPRHFGLEWTHGLQLPVTFPSLINHKISTS